MAGNDKSEKPEKAADKAPRERAKRDSVHVAYSDDRQTILIENSRVRALGHAVRDRLSYVEVPFGITFDAAVKAQTERDDAERKATQG